MLSTHIPRCFCRSDSIPLRTFLCFNPLSLATISALPQSTRLWHSTKCAVLGLYLLCLSVRIVISSKFSLCSIIKTPQKLPLSGFHLNCSSVLFPKDENFVVLNTNMAAVKTICSECRNGTSRDQTECRDSKSRVKTEFRDRNSVAKIDTVSKQSVSHVPRQVAGRLHSKTAPKSVKNTRLRLAFT